MLRHYMKYLTFAFLLLCFTVSGGLSYAAPSADEVQATLKQSREMIEKGRPEVAFKDLAKLISSVPDNVEAYILIAQASRNMGNLKSAQSYLERARSLDPKSDAVARNLIFVLGKNKGLAEAYAFVEKHYKNKPASKAALEGLVELCREKKEYAMMDKAVERLLEISPDESEYKELRMESLSMSGNPDEAHQLMVSMVRNILRSDRTAEDKTREIRRLQAEMKTLRDVAEKVASKKNISQPKKNVNRSVRSNRRPIRQPAVRRGRTDDAIRHLSPELRAKITKYQQQANQFLRDGRVMLALSYDLRAASLAKDPLYMTRTASSLVNQQRDEAAELYIKALLDHYPEDPQLAFLIKRYYDRKSNITKNNQATFESKKWHYYREAADAFNRIANSDAPLEQRLLARVDALRYEYRPQPFNRQTAAEVKAKLQAIAETEGATERVKQEVRESIQRVDATWIAPLDREVKRQNEVIPKDNN
jgi:predicted Zn-dependent protease